MDLLERSTELATLDEALADVGTSGRGTLVLIAGEAGIGKTALLETFCDGNRKVPILRGACDALFTHHVSAILRKLRVESRGQAVAEAARLGIGENRESSRSLGSGLGLASGGMNLHARLRRKQAPVQPVVKPAVACERVMLEAQRLAQQVARSRAAAQG